MSRLIYLSTIAHANTLASEGGVGVGGGGGVHLIEGLLTNGLQS